MDDRITISGGTSLGPLTFHRPNDSISLTAPVTMQAVGIFTGTSAFLITDSEPLPDLTPRQATITASRLRAIADELDRKAHQ